MDNPVCEDCGQLLEATSDDRADRVSLILDHYAAEHPDHAMWKRAAERNGRLVSENGGVRDE